MSAKNMGESDGLWKVNFAYMCILSFGLRYHEKKKHYLKWTKPWCYKLQIWETLFPEWPIQNEPHPNITDPKFEKPHFQNDLMKLTGLVGGFPLFFWKPYSGIILKLACNPLLQIKTNTEATEVTRSHCTNERHSHKFVASQITTFYS